MADDSNTRAARRTRVIVIVAVVLLAVYDLVVYLIWGGPATISTAVGNWSGASVLVSVLLGGLLGHLLRSGDSLGVQEYAVRIGAATVAAVVMFLVSGWSLK